MAPKSNAKEMVDPTPMQAEPGFFPWPDDFADYVGVPLEEFRGPRKVLVGLDVLRLLIGMAATAASFDEEFYLERNPDLRRAVKQGELTDPRAHFLSDGYFERRPASRKLLSPVNESWYLKQYADVAEGMKAGKVDSATHHYITTGRKEGRVPSDDLPAEIRRLLDLLHSGV